MANKGLGSMTASILPDEVKSTLTGACNYTPVTDEKWVYKQASITTSADTAIFATTDEFFGNAAASDSVATADLVKWIAVKHTGTTNGATSTNEGILLTQANGTVAHDATGANSGILIEPNDLFVAKFDGTTVADLQARTVALTGQSPTANGSSTVLIYIAAIINDVA
tara:strand:- start:10827 stop:11330 length:504 start_codon:yes stop_codon:yes gene_type:complete